MYFFVQIFFDHILTYWCLSLLLLVFDTLTINNWHYYKVRFSTIPDTWENIFKNILINQSLSLPFFFFLNLNEGDFFSIFYKIPLCLLIFEVIFYHFHFIFHIHPIFKIFHFQHHKWITPMGLSTFYCHPVEHVFLNITPLLISAKILNLNQIGFRIWHFLFLTNNILYSHGCYNFRNLHDKHHLDFDCNYGFLGIFDKLYGTFRYN